MNNNHKSSDLDLEFSRTAIENEVQENTCNQIGQVELIYKSQTYFSKPHKLFVIPEENNDQQTTSIQLEYKPESYFLHTSNYDCGQIQQPADQALTTKLTDKQADNHSANQAYDLLEKIKESQLAIDKLVN